MRKWLQVELLQVFLEITGELIVLQGKIYRRLQVTYLATTIVSPAFKTVRQHLFMLAQAGDGGGDRFGLGGRLGLRRQDLSGHDQ